MNKKIVIIGGGIIGLCSAFYLQKEGHQVIIIDKSNLDSGASYVNAGFLSPSHLIPLAAPGVVKQGLKWMFNSSSPLYIKPRLNLDFLKWTLAFNKSCNSIHVKKAIPAIKDLVLLSQDLYEDIKALPQFTFQYKKRGMLMLCQTERMLEEELKTAKIIKSEGLEVSELNKKEIEELQPNVTINAIGAAYYKCDSHTTPNEFMEDMKTHLKNEGVLFHTNEAVKDLEVTNGKISVIKTNKQKIKADEFVLAAGSWSTILSKKLSLKLLLQAGKGYRVNTKTPTGITIPMILAEKNAAVSPMNGFTRFAGTMEIAGINHTINKVRVEAIANAIHTFFPDIIISEEEKKNAACGLRPVTPDGLPYIGKSKQCSNLTIATGHAMMGWSMATATGKLVSEIIDNQKPSIDTSLFNPDRSF
jgi:D-amino-acid dehydrogenase